MKKTTRYELSKVLPWGRSFDEYVRMFNLNDGDLNGTILGCADGPASFNAEMHQSGRRVISCDPIYRFTKQQLKVQIKHASAVISEQTRKNIGNFVWSSIGSINELRNIRLTAMR